MLEVKIRLKKIENTKVLQQRDTQNLRSELRAETMVSENQLGFMPKINKENNLVTKEMNREIKMPLKKKT